MGRLARMGGWYIAFVSAFSFVFAAWHIEPNAFLTLPEAMAIHLFEWKQRWNNYKSDPVIPRIVIVGPSYAYALPPIPHTHNLAVVGISARGTLNLIKQCDGADLVIWLFSFREIIEGDRPPEFWTLNPLCYELALRKAFIRSKLHIPLAQERPLNPRSRLEIESNLQIDPEEYPKLSLERLTEHIDTLSPREAYPISLKPLESARKAHPNILFVQLPTFPLGYGNSQKINNLINAEKALRKKLSESRLPGITVSGLSPRFYTDLLHLTAEGKELVKNEIERISQVRNPGR